MSETLGYELRQQFVGSVALTAFIAFIGKSRIKLDGLEKNQQTLKVLNRIFSDPVIFQKYIDFIVGNSDKKTFLNKEVFFYICDYFSGLVIDCIDDIHFLPSFDEIQRDMQTNMIPGTNLSYAQTLKESVRKSLYNNSRGEILYFIEEQNIGNLVYSHQGGFHLVDDTGCIIFHDKGQDILGKAKLEKIRLYKRFLSYISGLNIELSGKEKSILAIYRQDNINKDRRIYGNEGNQELSDLRVRFSLVTDIQILEKEFTRYRSEIIKVIDDIDKDDEKHK